MGLIEQAAQRLEELRRAGINPPESTERLAALHSIGPRTAPEPAPAPAPTPAPAPAPAAASTSHARAPRLTMDLALLASLGFVTPDQPRSRIADEFRVIKRPLIANATGAGPAPIKHGNLIMVTSAVPGEGKTFSAVNLAMSIAMETDRTVLLVDADIARPSIPRTLGYPDGPGLLDILGGSVHAGHVIHTTNVDKLAFMSSGRQHPRAAEMLASDAMIALLHELATSDPDRIVVFDSPPLLVTTESRVLASRMGQIVFVVSAESTRQSEVTRALATIESCPVKMMVLNKATTAGQGAYGYGYGYGY